MIVVHRRQPVTRKLFVTLGLVALAAGAMSLTAPASGTDRPAHHQFFDPILDVYARIHQNFFKEPDLSKMQEGIIKGMLESLDDPYTEFIPSKDIAEFDKNIRGEFVGIGAEVRGQDGFLLVVSPLDDSPAYKSGVEADDLVVAVDGQSVFGLDVDAMISRLTGEPGTKVRVTFEREGVSDDLPRGALPPSVPDTVGEARGPKPGTIRFDLEITRQRIQTVTLKGLHRDGEKWDFMADPVRKIAYVRLTQFTATTADELERTSRELLGQGMRGMILDLRFNGGGSLGAAIGVADLFLGQPDQLIVKTKGRATVEERAYARNEGTLPDFPLIVLVNSASASASEIVAGALSDNNRAIVLGERTFGKGLVQAIYRMPSGAGQLKVTEAYYYLPSGRCIQREDNSAEWGVDPTPGFFVPMTNEETRQMWRVRREEEVLRTGARANGHEQNWSDPAWILEYLKDPQLSAAVRAIGAKLETGNWEPTGQDAPKGTLELAAMKTEQQRYDLLVRELARSARRLETLTSATGETAEPADLIPGDDDLTDGHVQVFDSEGNVVARLRITGANLEAWLQGAPLEPAAEMSK